MTMIMTCSQEMIKQLLKIQFVLALLLLSEAGLAQDKISWTDLSMEERQILQQLESQWDNLPAERQQRLRRGATRWQQMQPQERSQAQNQQRRFQNLSRQQQQLINRRFRQFNGLGLAEQRRLRNIQRRYQSLPEDQRQQLRQRFEQRSRQGNSNQSAEDQRRIREVMRQTENAIRRNANPVRPQQVRPRTPSRPIRPNQ